MKRTFSFGKIDFYGNGRKINELTIDIKLKETENGKVFTACGNVWNSRKTDCVMCGQCIDKIKPLKYRTLYNVIQGIWERNHCNDMHAGTIAQEECINNYLDERKEIAEEMNKGKTSYWSVNENDYNVQCELLKRHGLYEVELNGENYRYGAKWLFRPILEEDMKTINILFDLSKDEAALNEELKNILKKVA